MSTPGERLEELWKELLRAIAPLTIALAAQQVSRKTLLGVVEGARRVLDRIESEFLRG